MAAKGGASGLGSTAVVGTWLTVYAGETDTGTDWDWRAWTSEARWLICSQKVD